ncbi:MAG TPA: TetR/AcrR family transcriptional regulator [Novosphingobium sp.]|nr:TetR/AcrR family transcriptional regulator [Novosphingobium sp.]
MAGIAVKPQASSAKSVQKRERIIRAATLIINEKSFALATMTEIAAALDLRDATLYYYFSSKQALGYACHVASLERIERILLEACETEATGARRLRHGIHHILLDGEQHGSQLYFGDYSYLNENQRNHVDVWSDRLEAMMEQFLAEGIRDGSIVRCETRLVTKLLIGMLISLARWTWRVEGITTDSLMEAIGVASLNGLERR